MVKETGWPKLDNLAKKVNSSKKQFEANQIALEGVKEEFELGTRTNLDVLDAEQEFLDSQVSMISSENNSKLSMFYLLLSIGSLSPEELSLPISKYDPNAVSYTHLRAHET